MPPTTSWKRLHSTIELTRGKPDVQRFISHEVRPIDETKGLHRPEMNKSTSVHHCETNVTKGLVAKERTFFYEALGANKKEFLEILTMPSDHKAQDAVQKHGYLTKMETTYRALDSNSEAAARLPLWRTLNGNDQEQEVLSIIEFVPITKHKLMLQVGNEQQGYVCEGRVLVVSLHPAIDAPSHRAVPPGGMTAEARAGRTGGEGDQQSLWTCLGGASRRAVGFLGRMGGGVLPGAFARSASTGLRRRDRRRGRHHALQTATAANAHHSARSPSAVDIAELMRRIGPRGRGRGGWAVSAAACRRG